MIIGIDLGTTNSLVSVWKDGQSHVIPNALGHFMTPSVVGLDDKDRILVGMPARDRLLTHSQFTVSTFKRYMGTAKTFKLGKRSFRPEELSSFILASLKADAEAWLEDSVTEAVITVPAYFNDAQRKATRIAGELAGLKVERLLNEPTAAALAYGLHNKDIESQFLVFDLGGGTFDVSLLELFDGIMEVRASAGDNFLGGEDFVDRLVDGFISHIDIKDNLLKHDDVVQALRDQAERAKRELSKNNTAIMQITWKNQELSWEITKAEFEKLVQPLLEKLSSPIERALRDARVRVSDLNELVLVGGATRMPIIKKTVSKMFDRLPACNIDPDQVVAHGAAVQAGLKARDGALNEVVMTDVCPYSLGIEIAEEVSKDKIRDGIYLPIIERNVVIPASKVKTLYTMADFQRVIALKVYQGESPRVEDNIFLGVLNVPVPPKAAGEVSVDVRFSYNINGILEVELTVADTNEKHTLVIEDNPGVLTQSEIEKSLKALQKIKIHPREQTVNQALISRAVRLYEESLGDIRMFIGEQLSIFEKILEEQDPQRIEEVAKNLTDVLDQIEGDPYL